jgi:hypothetical protein
LREREGERGEENNDWWLQMICEKIYIYEVCQNMRLTIAIFLDVYVKILRVKFF